MGDGRMWETNFSKVDDGTKVIELFEAENENPEEMQKAGWQAILNNFKNYIENQGNFYKVSVGFNFLTIFIKTAKYVSTFLFSMGFLPQTTLFLSPDF